jgi:hypothetical protein
MGIAKELQFELDVMKKSIEVDNNKRTAKPEPFDFYTEQTNKEILEDKIYEHTK